MDAAGSRCGLLSRLLATLVNQISQSEFSLPAQLVEKRTCFVDYLFVLTVEASRYDSGGVVNQAKSLERFRSP